MTVQAGQFHTKPVQLTVACKEGERQSGEATGVPSATGGFLLGGNHSWGDRFPFCLTLFSRRYAKGALTSALCLIFLSSLTLL